MILLLFSKHIQVPVDVSMKDSEIQNTLQTFVSTLNRVLILIDKKTYTRTLKDVFPPTKASWQYILHMYFKLHVPTVSKDKGTFLFSNASFLKENVSCSSGHYDYCFKIK